MKGVLQYIAVCLGAKISVVRGETAAIHACNCSAAAADGDDGAPTLVAVLLPLTLPLLLTILGLLFRQLTLLKVTPLLPLSLCIRCLQYSPAQSVPNRSRFPLRPCSVELPA